MTTKESSTMFCFFSVRLLSVLRGDLVFYPRHNGQWLRLRRIFYPRFYPLHLFSYLNSWERASIFPFECSVLNKGNTGTIYITSLVWRGPWLGIEPGTSRTRSQHYITRLSRRRLDDWVPVNECGVFTIYSLFWIIAEVLVSVVHRYNLLRKSHQTISIY